MSLIKDINHILPRSAAINDDLLLFDPSWIAKHYNFVNPIAFIRKTSPSSFNFSFIKNGIEPLFSWSLKSSSGKFLE